MSGALVTIMSAGGVCRIGLNRPEKLNSFNAEMHADLRDALKAAAADDSVKVVVLTGEGRAFSAGQDLTVDLPRGEDGKFDLSIPLARDYNPLIMALADYPKITIAALNGPAVGASMNIALACDIVIAARSAYLQEGFAKIALVPDAGGTWILPRLVGLKRALALCLTADPVSADEAVAMGLIYRAYDDATFAEEAKKLALRMSSGPANAYGAMKAALKEALQSSLEEQLDLEARLQFNAGRNDNFMEGVLAFREKRAPVFR